MNFNNFNIEMVRTIGCKPALKYLRRKYGDQTADLTKEKKYIYDLIDDGKSEWVIHFCLHMMNQEKKDLYVKYLFTYVIDKIIIFDDENYYKLKQLCLRFSDVEEVDFDMWQDILCQISAEYLKLNYEEGTKEKQQNTLCIKLINLLLHYLSYYQKDYLRACRMLSSNLVEVCILKKIIEDNTQDISELRNIELRKHAEFAMSLTGIWKDD